MVTDPVFPPTIGLVDSLVIRIFAQVCAARTVLAFNMYPELSTIAFNPHRPPVYNIFFRLKNRFV